MDAKHAPPANPPTKDTKQSQPPQQQQKQVDPKHQSGEADIGYEDTELASGTIITTRSRSIINDDKWLQELQTAARLMKWAPDPDHPIAEVSIPKDTASFAHIELPTHKTGEEYVRVNERDLEFAAKCFPFATKLEVFRTEPPVTTQMSLVKQFCTLRTFALVVYEGANGAEVDYELPPTVKCVELVGEEEAEVGDASKTIQRLFGRGIDFVQHVWSADDLKWVGSAWNTITPRPAKPAFHSYTALRTAANSIECFQSILASMNVAEILTFSPFPEVFEDTTDTFASIANYRWAFASDKSHRSCVDRLDVLRDPALSEAFLFSRSYHCLDPARLLNLQMRMTESIVQTPAVFRDCLEYVCTGGAIRELVLQYDDMDYFGVGGIIGRMVRLAGAAKKECKQLTFKMKDAAPLTAAIGRLADHFAFVPELKELARTDALLSSMMADVKSNPKTAASVVAKRRSHHDRLVGEMVRRAKRTVVGAISDPDLAIYMGFMMAYTSNHRQNPLVSACLHKCKFGGEYQYNSEFNSMINASSPGGEIELCSKATDAAAAAHFVFNHISSRCQLRVSVEKCM